MNILALDPGNEQTGVVQLINGAVWSSAILPNRDVLAVVQDSDCGMLAIEMIASYGMPVGKEVFDTCVWIGRFIERWNMGEHNVAAVMVFRKDVKLHLCGSPRAKDGNIRQALLDKLGPQGTKKAPGPTYGIKSHAWAALGVAVTVNDQLNAA